VVPFPVGEGDISLCEVAQTCFTAHKTGTGGSSRYKIKGDVEVTPLNLRLDPMLPLVELYAPPTLHGPLYAIMG